MAGNTLVIATSDNGADEGFYSPIRDKKASIWEGGHRVPFFVRHPASIEPGRVNPSMFGLNDLYLTLSSIAGIHGDDKQGRDSFDVQTAFAGTKLARPEPLMIQEKGNSETLAVREGRWKLIRRSETADELHDLQTDLKETTDVSKQQPQVTKRLSRYLKNKLAERTPR